MSIWVTISIILMGISIVSYVLNRKDKNYICTYCGYKGPRMFVVQGSAIVEIILWLCFIIPGVIYSMWRLRTKEKICPSCNQRTMIFLYSPLGQKIKRELYGEEVPKEEKARILRLIK